MVPSLLTSAKCDSCNIPGAAKGKDEYGHIHCRMCSYRKHDDFKKTKRTEPAKGDLWNVYCYRAEKDVTVSERVPDDNHEHSHPKGSGSDDAPAAFRAPGNIFRGACRMITVIIGKGSAATTFVVHEPLLTSSSAYFQRALKSTFKEGDTGQVNLEEDDPQVFGLVNEYLYTGVIAVSRVDTDFLRWFSELWLLAHYLQIPRLVNYAMWRLVSWAGQDLNDASGMALKIREVEELYDRAPMESKLRKFLVDLLIWKEENKALEMSDYAPHSMMRDGIREAKRKASGIVKSPLLNVKNYYTKDEELVQVEGSMEEATVQGRRQS